MQFNLTTIFFLLPSLITLIIMRLRRQPWMKTLSVLGWRLGFLLGNTLQTRIFLLAHLLILLVGTYLWPLLAFPVLLGWVNGWLRYKSDSVLPGMLVHALGNTISDVLA